MIITVFHNTTSRFEEYSPGDVLEEVFSMTVAGLDGAADMDTLEYVFREFNVGDGLAADLYRAAKNRSLSVGDVVTIQTPAAPANEFMGLRRYACNRAGWKLIGD